MFLEMYKKDQTHWKRTRCLLKCIFAVSPFKSKDVLLQSDCTTVRREIHAKVFFSPHSSMLIFSSSLIKTSVKKNKNPALIISDMATLPITDSGERSVHYHYIKGPSHTVPVIFFSTEARRPVTLICVFVFLFVSVAVNTGTWQMFEVVFVCETWGFEFQRKNTWSSH